MIRPSDFLIASSTGVSPSLQIQCPLNFSLLHPKQEIQPVYFSNLNRSNLCISAPALTAPSDASDSKMSVFHPLRGPALTTTILFPIVLPLPLLLLRLEIHLSRFLFKPSLFSYESTSNATPLRLASALHPREVSQLHFH